MNECVFQESSQLKGYCVLFVISVSHPASRGSPVPSAQPTKPPQRPSPPTVSREYRDEVLNEEMTEHRVSICWNVTDVQDYEEGHTGQILSSSNFIISLS
jgi:hypothetical protein